VPNPLDVIPGLSKTGVTHHAGVAETASKRTVAASNEPGQVGQICWDANYLYLCTDTGAAGAIKWLRFAKDGAFA
jgi:hypothetical protein